MSYDISVGRESFNYTFNVSKLFYDHIPVAQDRGGLNELGGLTGKAASTVLAEAFERIHLSIGRDWSHNDVGEPKFCARYDPKNGWGSTLGAIVLLARLMAACHANPRCKVRVSCMTINPDGRQSVGASAEPTGLSSPTEPCFTVSALSGFDPSRFEYRFSVTTTERRERHDWVIAGKLGAVNIWAEPSVPSSFSDARWFGGIECHSAQPLEYSGGRHERCWLLGAECWHDGSRMHRP